MSTRSADPAPSPSALKFLVAGAVVALFIPYLMIRIAIGGMAAGAAALVATSKSPAPTKY